MYIHPVILFQIVDFDQPETLDSAEDSEPSIDIDLPTELNEYGLTQSTCISLNEVGDFDSGLYQSGIAIELLYNGSSVYKPWLICLIGSRHTQEQARNPFLRCCTCKVNHFYHVET